MFFKCFDPILQQIFGMSFTENPISCTLKIKKDFFHAKKIKTFFDNIVLHSRVNAFAKYEII